MPHMKFVIFGLSISSAWGNGHATLWRGLWRALVRRGHRLVFFERDVPYYAEHRDLTSLPGGEIVLYETWEQTRRRAARELAEADVAIVTSYCPDGPAAAAEVLDSRARLKTFYDLDTPVTLSLCRSGQHVPYLPSEGLHDFDLVLSYTGGPALPELEGRLGAKRVAPLYGSVDPDAHRPVGAADHYRCDLSYLGTYAGDRHAALDALLVESARRRPEQSFLIGGSQYPSHLRWPGNVRLLEHVPPPDHPAFFCSSRLTLNVTRGVMAAMGYCPSGRLFEAAACGVPILSDRWPGLEEFFEPRSEIIVARSTQDALAALDERGPYLQRVARAARERVLASHTADRRASELEAILDAATGRISSFAYGRV
jgi:spore maturation protein CgeB